MEKTVSKKKIVRMCIWVDADIRERFSKEVRRRHGGERGGTGMEAERALRIYLKDAEGARHFCKSNMNKLLDLVMDLDGMKGYPRLSLRVIRWVIQTAVGKDERTIKKYLKAVRARSKIYGGAWAIEWDVSQFVDEVYWCNRSGADPKYIIDGRARKASVASQN